MNVIFTAILLLSAIIMCVYCPQDFLPAMLGGAKGAAECALTLFCVYAVWMGISAVAEESGLTDKAAQILAKPCKKLFKTRDGEAVKNIAMNISCNLLGIGGAATPYAVKAVNALERENNTFAQNMLFIINATSIQLVPTTIIAVRAAAGSKAAHDIALPSLIATLVSTLTGVVLYVLYERLALRHKKRRAKCNT